MRGSRRGGGGERDQKVKPRGEGCGARDARLRRLGQRFPQVRSGAASGSPRRTLLRRVPSAGSPQRAPLGQVSSSAGSPQWARAASGDRAEGRRRRESLARGSRSWTRLWRPRRPEARRERARGRAGALVPSRLPADRGAVGTQRPDLSPGRVPGRRAMPRAPASASSPGLPRPRPSGRRRLLLHRPRDQRHPSPPPAPPGPGPPRPRFTSGRPGPSPGCGSRKNAWPAEGGGGAALPAPGPGRGGVEARSLPRARRLRAPRPAGRVGGRKRRRP